MKKLFNLILFVVFLILGVILALKNPQPVLFSFPFIEVELELGWLMLGAFVVGLLVGALLLSFSLMKTKMVSNKTKRQLVKVEKEVENLRAMPIKDEV